jgi:hypothetical protein
MWAVDCRSCQSDPPAPVIVYLLTTGGNGMTWSNRKRAVRRLTVNESHWVRSYVFPRGGWSRSYYQYTVGLECLSRAMVKKKKISLPVSLPIPCTHPMCLCKTYAIANVNKPNLNQPTRIVCPFKPSIPNISPSCVLCFPEDTWRQFEASSLWDIPLDIPIWDLRLPKLLSCINQSLYIVPLDETSSKLYTHRVFNREIRITPQRRRAGGGGGGESCCACKVLAPALTKLNLMQHNR